MSPPELGWLVWMSGSLVFCFVTVQQVGRRLEHLSNIFEAELLQHVETGLGCI